MAIVFERERKKRLHIRWYSIYIIKCDSDESHKIIWYLSTGMCAITIKIEEQDKKKRSNKNLFIDLVKRFLDFMHRAWSQYDLYILYGWIHNRNNQPHRTSIFEKERETCKMFSRSNTLEESSCRFLSQSWWWCCVCVCACVCVHTVYILHAGVYMCVICSRLFMLYVI